jgi:ABC-type phosphate transport system substrate-binding protein
MKTSRMFVLFFLMIAVVPCFAHHMAVVVNKDNHVADIPAAHLARICRLEARKWPDGKDVTLVLHTDSPGELATLERLTHMSQSELKAFVASHKDVLTLADSDAEVLRIVETTPGAIGLVDVRSINDQVTVLKVGGKLPMEDGYLSH